MFLLVLLLGLLVWVAVARIAPGSPRRASKRLCWCFLLGALPPGAGQTSETKAQGEDNARAWEFWFLLALAAYGLLNLAAKLQTALFGTLTYRKAARAPARNEGSKRRKPSPREPALACTHMGKSTIFLLAGM